MSKFEGGVAAWPVDYPISGGGVQIAGWYLHPSLDNNLPGMAFMLAFLGGLVVLGATENILAVLAFWVGMYVFFGAFRRWMTRIYGKKIDVKVFADRVEISSGRRCKKYSRGERMEFSIEPHHKGLEEKAREARGGRRQVLWRDALEVIMYYGEMRVPIADFRGVDLDLARALVFRIQRTMETRQKVIPDFDIAKPWPSDFGPPPHVPFA